MTKSHFCTILFALGCLAGSQPVWGGDKNEPASIWIEAEDAASTNFILGKTVSAQPTGGGASGGYVLSLNSADPNAAEPKAPPFFTEYAFNVQEAGSYRLWIACGPQNLDWVSPFVVSLDGKGWKDLQGKKAGDCYASYYGWVDGEQYQLSAGRHVLRFEVRNQRKMDKCYVAFLDAFFYTKDLDYIPKGNHPKYSTQPRFSEALNGMSYGDYVAKLEKPIYQASMASRTQEKIGPESASEVIRKLANRPIPDGSYRNPGPHVFGLHGMEAPFVRVGKDAKKVEQAYELLAKVGVQTLRTAEGCWHRLGDKFDNFSELDYQFQNAKKYGMTFSLTMGYPAIGYANVGFLSAVKPEFYGKYREYLRTVLSRYKGKGIEYVELGNEVDAPDVWWKGSTPKMYVAELAMMKEEITSSDPKIKLLAFGATYARDEITGGKSGGRRFINQCFEEGADKYADAYSLHYTWATSEKDFPAFLRREMEKGGGKQKPLINSEEAGWGEPSDVIKAFARDFFLYDMVCVDYYLAQDWFEEGCLIYTGLFDKDWNPKLRLLPYAVAADAMKYRDLVGMAAPAPGVEAYVLKYADGIKGAGAAYSIVMWKNDAAVKENCGPNIVKTIGLAPVSVTGFNKAASAVAWNLDNIKLNGASPSIAVTDQPVVVYCNALPDWKLISAKDWLLQNVREADSKARVPNQ